MLPQRYPLGGQPQVPGATLNGSAPAGAVPPPAAPAGPVKGPDDFQRIIGTGPFNPRGPGRYIPGLPGQEAPAQPAPSGGNSQPQPPGAVLMPPPATPPAQPADYPVRGGFGIRRTVQAEPGGERPRPTTPPAPPMQLPSVPIYNPPPVLGYTNPMPGSGTVSLPPSTAPLPAPTNPRTGPVLSPSAPVTGRGGVPLGPPSPGGSVPTDASDRARNRGPIAPSSPGGSGSGSGSGDNTNSAIDRWWDPGPASSNINDYLPQQNRSGGGGGGGGGGAAAPAGPDWRQIQFDENARQFDLTADDNMLLALNRMGMEGYQFDDRLGFDYAGLDERARQYDMGYDQQNYQFDANMGQRQDEFGQNMGQQQYEFNTNMDQRRSEFGQDFGLRDNQQRFQQALDQSAFEYKQKADTEQNAIAREGQSLQAFGRRIKPNYGF